jgi:hypothetical protein
MSANNSIIKNSITGETYPNLFSDLQVSGTITCGNLNCGSVVLNQSNISAYNFTSTLSIGNGPSDVFIPLIDYLAPIGFTPNGGYRYFNSTSRTMRVLVIGTANVAKTGTNCNFQLMLCRDLGIGGYQRIARQTQWVDKAEGHNVFCQSIFVLDPGEGVFLAGRTDTSTVLLTQGPSVNGTLGSSATLNVIEL